MTSDAQVTMMFYFGLTKQEETKLQAIENGVLAHVQSARGNVRPIWKCESSGDTRLIQLCVPDTTNPVIWQATFVQLATMSSADVLAELQH